MMKIAIFFMLIASVISFQLTIIESIANVFKDAQLNSLPILETVKSKFNTAVDDSDLKVMLNSVRAVDNMLLEKTHALIEVVSINTGLSVGNDVNLLVIHTLLIAVISVFGITTYNAVEAESSDTPYEVGTQTYDVDKADAFYKSRPFLVFSRLLYLTRVTSAFNIKLLLDWKLGNLEKNEKERAKEALVLANQLGPTFIKLGQALSIRTGGIAPH